MSKKIPVSWQLGFSPTLEGEPREWIPATVPGAVQLDWAAAKSWKPFFEGENWADYLWMEDVFWTYRAAVRFPAVSGDSRIALCSEGIDYQFLVRVDGRILHEQEGMFTPFTVDLTEFSGREALLEIVVFPAPKSHDLSRDRTQANACCKPPVSYGWDFHPRLIPLGIWQETGVEIRSVPSIDSFAAEVELAPDRETASVRVRAMASLREGDYLEWMLADPDGQTVAQERLGEGPAGAFQCTIAVARPRLWWPHDQGDPALYTAKWILRSSQGEPLCEAERRIGFRSVRLVMNEGTWDEPRDFPKSRSKAPITLEINGRRIFAKGSNWVSPDIFPGRITESTYRPLLELAKQSNLNILRLWGGAIVQKDSFYRLCDELGILVWQEFPLACNEYPDSGSYLQILEQEARSIVRKLKHHPSLVIWCGGNELFNSWSGMTDQSLALRMLNKICLEDDPTRPFLPTSPVEGMGHGAYFFRDPHTGEEAWETFQKSRCTAYTEFGCCSPAGVEVLREIIPPEELFPPKPGTSWQSHHGFEAFRVHGHLFLPSMAHYFGESKSLEELVCNGQLMQAEGLRGMFEEARRQKPYASMAINWCFNEPWPTAANNSIVSWPCRPKPALETVRDACRPVLASARIPKFSWRPDECFQAEIWILNDSPHDVEGGAVEAFLEVRGSRIPLLKCFFPALPAGQNWKGPMLQAPAPDADEKLFRLILEVPGRTECRSVYSLATQKPEPLKTGVRAMND